MSVPATGGRPEAVVETLLSVLADGVLTVDADGVVREVDAATGRLLGLERSMPLAEAEGPVADSVRDVFERVRATGSPVAVDASREGQSSLAVAVPLGDAVHIGLRALDAVPSPDPEDATRYRSLVRAVPDPLYMLDRDGRFTFVSEALASFTGYGETELLGTHVSLLMDQADIDVGEALIRDLLKSSDRDTGVFELDVITAAGERIHCENHIAVLVQDGRFTGTAGSVRDVTDRIRRERELRQQRNELTRLNHINTVVRSIVQTLVTPTSREALERAVCQRLATPGPYAAAWFGEYDVSEERLVPNAAVGIDTAPFTEALETAKPNPSVQAARSRQVVVIRDDDADLPDCAAALQGLGFVAGAAIPVVSGNALYGVLHVYTTESDAFDDEETAVLAELGRIIGGATRARLTEQLLHAGERRELVFQVRDDAFPLVAAATETDATLVLEQFIPTEDDVALYYGRVHGDDVEAFLDCLAHHPDVEALRAIGELGDETAVELCLTGALAAIEYSSYGMAFHEAEVREGVVSLRVSLAADASVRSAVEAVTTAFPAAELVAQRQIARELRTANDFRAQVFESFTPRQRAALDAAVHAGYFEWPRGSTAEEVAAAMGISAATFHSHLRKAERKLYDALYERRE